MSIAKALIIKSLEATPSSLTRELKTGHNCPTFRVGLSLRLQNLSEGTESCSAKEPITGHGIPAETSLGWRELLSGHPLETCTHGWVAAQSVISVALPPAAMILCGL